MLSSANTQADFALDLNGLHRLRNLAQNDQGKALGETAKQFEALFIQMMLKGARNASMGDELFGSNRMDFYRDMFDQQLALTIAQRGNTGIGDLLVKQLQVAPPAAGEGQAEEETITPFRRFVGTPKPIQIPSELAAKAQAPAGAGGEETGLFDSPAAFVEKLRPYAEKAAARLGVSPEVLLSQAALETGWGKYISTDSEGKSSFNLFNIKAGAQWAGKTIALTTQEFINGGFIKENAHFRAYSGFADSFEDYVDFLQSNPRYSDVISQANSDIGFAQALQGAGYATDPDYASKITRVLQSSAMAEAFGKLKFSQSEPLTRRDG